VGEERGGITGGEGVYVREGRAGGEGSKEQGVRDRFIATVEGLAGVRRVNASVTEAKMQ
jgi:hypothetical protein